MCWGIFGVSLVAAHDVIDQGAPPSNTAWWDGYIELVDERNPREKNKESNLESSPSRGKQFKKNVITACSFGFMKGGHYRMSPIFITPPKTSPFKVSEVFVILSCWIFVRD